MTSSADFIVDHAYRNVWQAPGMDRQHTVAPQRLSKRQGEITNVKVGMHVYNLPTLGTWYHVFMIGDLPPALVGMDTIKEKWVNAKAHCVSTSLLIDLFLTTGVHIPLHRSYFLYTKMGAMLIAIQATPNIGNFGVVQPFIRWRSNAWFDQLTQIPKNGGIEVEGMTINTTNEFYTFQAKWKAAKTRPGYAWAFVNGRRVRDINLTTMVLGDTVEYVRDASVREVFELPIKDLVTFDSTLDNKGKYMLWHAGLGSTIDYVDDIDIYVLNYQLAAKYDGVFYPPLQDDWIRNVTHRDLSIPTAYLNGVVEDQKVKGWIWNNDLRVEVIIRNSGLIKPLVNEAHRIKELFKLEEGRRHKAMIGQELCPIWKAAELEASQYPAVMRAADTTLTVKMVEEAYGYNAISKILADTPMKIGANNGWVPMPWGLRGKSTVYEYGGDGRMMGWYIHDNSVEYPLRNPGVKYIEAYVGRGGAGLSTVYDQATTKLEVGVDYRFYVAHIRNGVPQNDWIDVTGDATYYTIKDLVVTWKIDTGRYNTAIRNSKDFLAYDVELNYRDDVLAFSINVNEVKPGRVTTTGVMDIPPGEVDLFLNDAKLVYKIDYDYNYPEFCIFNKSFLVEGPVQKVHVRARGFANKALEIEVVKDSGFVKHGQLSRNSQFNIRDDKVSVITIGGSIYTRDEVGVTEDGTTITVDVKDGTPYQIRQPMIPMMGVTDIDTYTMRAAAEAIDKTVEDYLTQYIPEVVLPDPVPTPGWYAVFSPFTTKLIYDMLNGILTMDEFKGVYGDDLLRERLKGYDWLLQYDPALKDVDEQYVIIHPHPENVVIELNIYQYRLLDKAIKLFLNDNVILNRRVVIVEEGFEHDQRDHPHPHRLYSEVGE